jgi:flagellar biosynthesis GTPase FlhF
LKLTPRRQEIFDWYDKNWEQLVGQGISEEKLKELFRGKARVGTLIHAQDAPHKDWVLKIWDAANDLRPKWRKTTADILEAFFEIGLHYFEHLRTPDLPEPQPLPGTPPHKKNGQPSLKHTKDTLKLGERLLTSKYDSLGRDIDQQFAIGKAALNAQVMAAVEKSKNPLAKEIQKKSDQLEETRKKATEMSVRLEETERKQTDLRDEFRRIEKEVDDQERKIRDDDQEIELLIIQHRNQIKAKFKEAEGALNLERQRLLRDLQIQREHEIDTMWSEHLPESIRNALARVPEIATITGELPKSVRALIASES